MYILYEPLWSIEPIACLEPTGIIRRRNTSLWPSIDTNGKRLKYNQSKGFFLLTKLLEKRQLCGHEPDAADASTEYTLHPSIHLSRRRNLLASPLLRLPTELILKIFAHAVELDGDNGDDDDDGNHGQLLLIITVICHQLRETGIASPQLWSTIDLTTPLIAELFLERCKYDPHTLIKSLPASENIPGYSVKNPRRDALWKKLQGRTFNRLCSIVFEGSQHEFALMVVGILQRAPNISNLDLCSLWSGDQELPWPISDPISNPQRLHPSSLRILGQLDFTSPSEPDPPGPELPAP